MVERRVDSHQILSTVLCGMIPHQKVMLQILRKRKIPLKESKTAKLKCFCFTFFYWIYLACFTLNLNIKDQKR